MGSRTDAVKQYKKSENKQKKKLKALKKKIKMLYRISNKSGSRHEIKNIKKIREKASNKRSESSGDDLDPNSALDRDSIWETYRRTSGSN